MIENVNKSSTQGRTAKKPDDGVETLIEELQERLRYTRSFLEKLRESDPAAKSYVEEIAESLNSDLKRLKRKL